MVGRRYRDEERRRNRIGSTDNDRSCDNEEDTAGGNKSIFVTNFPKSLSNERDLEQTFKRYGVISHVSISQHKPYAVIDFDVKESVQCAVEGARELVVDGHKISVAAFIPNLSKSGCNVYFKDFRREDSEDYLSNLFGTGQVLSFSMPTTQRGSYRGYGFACYENRRQASRAISALHHFKLPSGSRLYVAIHEPSYVREQRQRLEAGTKRHIKGDNNDNANRDLKHKNTESENLNGIHVTSATRDGEQESNSATSKHFLCDQVDAAVDGLQKMKLERTSDDFNGKSKVTVQRGDIGYRSANEVLYQHFGIAKVDDKLKNHKQKRCIRRSPSVEDLAVAGQEVDAELESSLSMAWIQKNCKPCPNCTVPIQNDGVCNKLTCTQCHHEFCWVCSSMLSETEPYAHYKMFLQDSNVCPLL